MLATILSFLLIQPDVDAQNKLRTVENRAFKSGEVLEYRVHYGIIDAGEARLEVMPDKKNIGPREVYHVVGTGQTKGAFDWFFKVRDRYESFVDSQALIPWLFIRRVNEGGYKINQDVSFNHVKNIAVSKKATIATPQNVQDLISAFYYARTLDYSNAQKGDIFELDAYLDDAVIPIKFVFVGRENLKTKFGNINCLKFHPQLLEGRVFKNKEDMTLWVSDDENKIPIRAEAQILVGSVKMDIKNYSGLANELSSLADKK
ncbi:MAG: DUF3108 domain-containing protein [Bacteroidetes bacterium]|nr:DUF3108 domain-containing protein [Bacteroidota bacterium]